MTTSWTGGTITRIEIIDMPWDDVDIKPYPRRSFTVDRGDLLKFCHQRGTKFAGCFDIELFDAFRDHRMRACRLYVGNQPRSSK